MSNPTSGANVFKEGVASVGSINRYDPAGTEDTGASYKVQNVKSQRCTYNFARDGGAVGTITLALPYTIPTGAFVTRVFTDVQAALTSGGAATVSIGLNNTTDILGATAFNATPFLAGANSVVLAGGAALVVGTADYTTLNIAIGTAALTAGDVTFIVEYIEGSDE